MENGWGLRGARAVAGIVGRGPRRGVKMRKLPWSRDADLKDLSHELCPVKLEDRVVRFFLRTIMLKINKTAQLNRWSLKEPSETSTFLWHFLSFVKYPLLSVQSIIDYQRVVLYSDYRHLIFAIFALPKIAPK